MKLAKRLLAGAASLVMAFGLAAVPLEDAGVLFGGITARAEYDKEKNVWIDAYGNENRIYSPYETIYIGGATLEDGIYHSNPYEDTVVFTEPDTCTKMGFDIIQRDVTVLFDNSHDFYYIYSFEGHNILEHSYIETVIPPTYEEGGYTEHKCARCGYSYNTDHVDPLVKEADPSQEPTDPNDDGQTDDPQTDNGSGSGSTDDGGSTTDELLTTNINKAKITLKPTEFTYDGTAKKPDVTVKDVNYTLIIGVDYTLKYKNNVNIGTATVTITGKGIYAGSVDKKYTIKAADISGAAVSFAKAKTYTGKSITQTPVVKLSGKTLKSGTDYTVTYKNNKSVGTATVTITGKGAYTGTVTKTFKINPKATSISKLTSPKSKKLKVTYKKVSGVTGYQVTYSTSKKFTKSTTKTVAVKGAKKTSATVSKLKAGKKYYVKVRSYKTVNGKKYYSSYSKVKSVKVKK